MPAAHIYSLTMPIYGVYAYKVVRVTFYFIASVCIKDKLIVITKLIFDYTIKLIFQKLIETQLKNKHQRMNNSKFSFNLNTTGSATNTTTGGLFGSTSTTPNTATTTGSTIGGPQQTTLNLFGFGSKSATTTSNTTQQQPVGTGGLNTSSSFNTGFGQQQPKQTTLSFGNTSTIAAVQPFGSNFLYSLI
jgi:hypothetical protein